jgi:hypothetical protein
VALIVALLAMVVIAGLGFALMVSSSTESMINASFRRSSLAYFSARGGIEEARGRMGPDALPVTNNPLTSVQIPCSPPSVACPPLYNAITGVADVTRAYYILLSNAWNPTNAGCTYLNGAVGNCRDENPPPGGATFYPTTQPGTQIPYVWTKITLATQHKLKRNLVTPCNPSDPADPSYCDPATLDDTQMVCWWNQTSLSLYNPANPFGSCGNPINPVYILTSLTIQPGTPTPTTRLVREVVAPGRIPGLPGPLTLDGIPAIYNAPAAFPFILSGCDASNPPPCNAPPDAPALVVPNAGDVADAQLAITDGPPPANNRNPRYAGVTNNGCAGAACNAPDSASAVAATDVAAFPNGNPLTTNPFFANCAGVNLLQSYITAAADFIYNGDTNDLNQLVPNTSGSFDNNDTVINVINGNANLAAADLRPTPADTGAGILLVTGNLTMAGTSNYHGIIIVLGGTIEIGGGGGGTITGGIFVTNTTTCPAFLGGATFFPNGGAITIQYDSTWANPPLGWLPMQILSMN